MSIRLSIATLAIAVGAGLSGFGLLNRAVADPALPHARARAVPVMVPIGCLMTRACLEGSGFEGARDGSVVSVPESASASPPGVNDVTSSDPVVANIDATVATRKADELLAVVRAELLGVSREDLLRSGPMPQVHGIIGPIPGAVQDRLTAYANSDDFFSCALVFRAMRKANADVQDAGVKAQVLWDLYLRYIDLCHKGTLDGLGEARDRLVVFVRKNRHDAYYAFCLGFNFSGNYVLTAHHCLVEPDEIDLMVSRFEPSDPDAFIVVDGPPVRSRALVVGEPSRLFALRVPANIPQELNFYPFVRDKDAVVLELDTVDRRPVANFPLAQVEEWDSISVPALFVDDDVLSKAIDSSRPDQVTLAIREGSPVDISPLCSLVYSQKSDRPFVFHACQTRYGYSGAPILRRGEDGRIALVGVHTGSVDKDKPVDDWPYQVLFPNYGLRLPATFSAFGLLPRP